MASDCRHRLHLRWNPSVCDPRHRYYILCRLLQTGRRFSHGRDHCQQKPLGLRIRRIHHPVGFEGTQLCSTNNDKYEPDNSLVLFRNIVLLLRQDFQAVVEKQLSTQTVKDGQQYTQYM